MTDFIAQFADRSLGRSDLAPLAGKGPVHLVACDFEEADLTGLDLTEWVFERCGFKQANLAKATLELTKWTHCKGPSASFKGSNLEDAAFASSDFNNASFRSAVLSSAKFDNCKLTGADLSDAKTLDVHFANTLLVSAKLSGVSFRKLKLVGLDFSSADLANCDFRDAVFENSSLREANIEQAKFQDADLRGADLGGLTLLREAVRFRGAVVSAAQAELILSEVGLRVRAR